MKFYTAECQLLIVFHQTLLLLITEARTITIPVLIIMIIMIIYIILLITL